MKWFVNPLETKILLKDTIMLPKSIKYGASWGCICTTSPSSV